MSTKVAFIVQVTQTVEVALDPTKFTPDFMNEYNKNFSDFGDDLARHAEQIAYLEATGQIPHGNAFVEGYGPIRDMGIEVSNQMIASEVLTNEQG